MNLAIWGRGEHISTMNQSWSNFKNKESWDWELGVCFGIKGIQKGQVSSSSIHVAALWQFTSWNQDIFVGNASLLKF